MQEDADLTNVDMTQCVVRVERAIKERRESDKPLINYWLYFLLVSWVTLHIYTFVVFFQRMVRIDRFSTRKRMYYEGLITWTSRYAQRLGREDEVHDRIGDMRDEIDAAYSGDMRQINAGLSLLFTILTLGIFGFYVLYRMRVIHRFDSLRVIYISDRRACMKDGLFLEMIGLPHANQRNRPSPCIIPRASPVTS